MLNNPTLGIVLPLFKHSVLVEEAIVSILNQKCEEELALVIVNDGCPHVETDEICKFYTNLFPQKIFYVRKANGGLSSARNAGIDYLLRKFSSIEAIYFLDADNRIFPTTLSRIWNVLKNEPKNIGWVYPDIDMFGTDYNLDTGGNFSVLRLLFQNYCEAGSMTRREVFESGARYDEQMLLGYEDWEFWYQAIECGFRGKHVENFGFQYRKRPESMLANSTRDDMQIKSYMQRKHKKLFSLHSLLSLEEDEAPRYNILFENRSKIYQYLDPNNFTSKVISEEEYFENFFNALFDPSYNHTPPVRGFASKKVWRRLQDYKLLNWLHWKIDNMFGWMDGFIAVNVLSSEDNQIHINIKHNIKTYDEIKHAGMIFVKRDLLTNIVTDQYDDWFQTLFSNSIQPHVNVIEFSLPVDMKVKNEIVINELRLGVQLLRHKYEIEKQEKRTLPQTWKRQDLLFANDLNKVPKSITELSSLYPLSTNKFSIGFILPLSSFGGVEKVTHNLAKALKKLGYSTHLFIVNSSSYTLFEAFKETYDSVNFLVDDEVGHWTKEKSFFGVGTTTWHGNFNKQKRALALLSGMNMIVNQHSIDMLSITGMLKRLGIKTIDYLHLLDKTIIDEDTGHPLVGIAYEHGFDKFVVISQKLRHLLHGMGVPDEKIVVIPNAPSYEIAPKRLKTLQSKKENRTNKKLHILFIGRLDRQKGLDRLEKIHAITKTLNVQWRIVGKSVLAEEGDSCPVCQIAEPPVFDDAALTGLYEWADCIVMPSYNEGVPLVMLEAMRLGAIPICSDVGAIDEVISDGKNGFLIKNETKSLIMDFVSTISGLAEDMEYRKKMQKYAMMSSAKYSWSVSAEIFENSMII